MAKRTGGESWPVLKRYDQDHLARIALPLGGIGTGTVSLGGRGDLRDWEVMNRPAKGFVPGDQFSGAPFFALYAKPAGKEAVTRILEGPVELSDYEGAKGSEVPNHGLPRFRKCSFAAAYPLGQVSLRDPDVPVDVRLEAFNPLVPGDADASGIPIAVLRFVLRNRTGRSVTASVCGSMQNFIGWDGTEGECKGNRNRFRQGKQVRGIAMDSKGVPPEAAQWGTMALGTTARTGVSYRTVWLDAWKGLSMLDFWDDFSGDGVLDKPGARGDLKPVASLAVRMTLPPRATKTVTFFITWHFPNRITWTLPKSSKDWNITMSPGPGFWNPGTRNDGSPAGEDDCCETGWIGNYYTKPYRDAWDVLEQTVPRLGKLEQETVRFVRAFCETDLPEVVKEAALFNLSTLRSQTCFRTPDGRFYGFEGCFDERGCCLGSCTHVWNYEQALAFLFGDLAKAMREVEFAHAMRDDGMMSFRVHLPIAQAQDYLWAAADGQMGCVMKMYRDWQLSGDDEMLRSLWPKVKQALEFCWIPGGWDADRDGVMEGCQHNTMDVEYFGPNPQIEIWYLGALRAAEEMARYLGDGDFADTCRDLFKRGKAWTDAHLFNGEYYEQEIRPPGRAYKVAEGLSRLRDIGLGSKNLSDPDFQLGPGCLVDQLIGQLLAHVLGLGYLVNPAHVRKTLRSILKYNLRNGLHGHFNCLLSFALGDESALLMASYPKGRPAAPFPYYTTVMTGYEYTAAIGMLYEKQIQNGLRCIQNIRDRYDGRKRSPFDEAECGHHYARAMVSWAAHLALTGFHYSGVEKRMTFAAQEGTFFWSNGYAWGTCSLKKAEKGMRVKLSVLYGELTLSAFVLRKFGQCDFDRPMRTRAGKEIRFWVLPIR